MVHDLARTDRIAAARVLRTDAAQTSIQTHEKSMRAEDRSFGGLLIIEGLDEAAVRAALSRLKTIAPQFGAEEFAALPLYTMFFSLHRRLLPGG